LCSVWTPFNNGPKDSNSKLKEGNNLFSKWQAKTATQITSSRLGISYTTSINANDKWYIKNHSSEYIYTKVYNNYKVNTNYKPKTKKRQERRHISTRNHIFHTNTEKAITSTQDKLFVARKHHFLFNPDQRILKPIHYLRYKNLLHKYPHLSDYSFWTPFDYFSKRKPKPTYCQLAVLPSNTSNFPASEHLNSKDTLTDNSQKNKKKKFHPKINDLPIPNWTALPSDVKIKDIYIPLSHKLLYI
jgi:hypothetical protein